MFTVIVKEQVQENTCLQVLDSPVTTSEGLTTPQKAPLHSLLVKRGTKAVRSIAKLFKQLYV